jgi:hypothetical protein
MSAMIDILERLDAELDTTPHGHYTCRPLPRSIVAAAAAEIRRLRIDNARLARSIAELAATMSPDTVIER